MTSQHLLLVAAEGEVTRGDCTCGEWHRDVDGATVIVTGRSREQALRDAHDLHARGIVKS